MLQLSAGVAQLGVECGTVLATGVGAEQIQRVGIGLRFCQCLRIADLAPNLSGKAPISGKAPQSIGHTTLGRPVIFILEQLIIIIMMLTLTP